MDSLNHESTDNEGMQVPLLVHEEDTNGLFPIASLSQPRGIPARYVVAIWAFLGFLFLYSLRVNLSVAIVAMTNPQSTTNESVEACPAIDDTNSSSFHPRIKGEFDWTPKTQGFILGSFFYGYVLTQVIGGILAEKFGAKWIFGGSILIAGILTLLTPLAARTNVYLLIAIRLLIGIFEAPAFPSAAALWGRWVPPLERSIIPPFASTGKEIGIVITTPLVSQLCASKIFGGWPSAFYVCGVLSCLWFIGWALYGHNSPAEHPRITYEEKLYLLRCVPKQKRCPIPWCRIMTCIPLYGIAIQHVCTNFVFYILLTSLPTYFSTILRFNLKENGIMFAIPFLFQLIFTIISGHIADIIRARNILSTTATRRWQTIIGACGTSFFLFLVGTVGCNHVLAVIFISLSVGFIGFQGSGSLISHLDIASNYAGTITGITNMLAAIPGFVGPIFVGWMTNHNQTLDAWKSIFNVSSSVCLFGCIMYCILFNGEEQLWNRDDAEQ
ncbi:unnamed protein product [Rotaria magnacalcarata]|uniref:Sialin n=1 Tax=Rotaria magnacalcarata TaxID=392030 RepID=A0A815MES8_9BILA|nr:unnamed protein product [Rotaria magnacalcarata]CAF1644226.1 unnamed protein product [Rotaria magnacalcarata]CAF2087777.1 unnamed protein product [Rotaria magnacalcarata]CAF3785067.1 unnamed protein product [Rotaria magnacalcarata]CAF3787099.1 unnamed protein product [Rotaria magnacalcarata]